MPELMLPQTAPEPLKESDSNNIQMGDKRKPKNVGKNLMCRLQSIFPSSSSNAEASKPSKLTTEEALLWSQSLEKLLESKYGMTTFRAFLRSEFSDENIEFWLTCEDFKKVKSSRLSSKAKKIYEHYIRAEAPKEINIDHHTRETIKANVQNPTIHCFDDAQKIVYGLMERDSYPRFLRSDIYQILSGKLQPDSVNGPTSDEVNQWAQSFDKLLAHKYGQAAFRIFLKSEYCEENIEFWLACEEYKKIKSPVKLASKAKKIHEEFIWNKALKEINLDYHTKKDIMQNLHQPTATCFYTAQKKVYSLMENNSYPRFLLSEIYQELCSVSQEKSKYRKS
ncbi:hypothetical protein EOD39_7181 [Acipenser ruthenus]|uniref:RGS domain-containing protein n=2 Tax=Acipenseridae TaxID=7900 RepID=A0A444U7V0_ACIRT|nr:hypothetical protein EOD39_7181 [Acipenser ruthenus]